MVFWHNFKLKLEQLICKKALKFALLDSYFLDLFTEVHTARKVSKYGVISGPYFPVLGLNTLLRKSQYSVRMQENTDQK